jgi:hypothetical protein
MLIYLMLTIHHMLETKSGDILQYNKNKILIAYKVIINSFIKYNFIKEVGI